jgi:uncharacterized protein YbgA (DUF1722 family)
MFPRCHWRRKAVLTTCPSARTFKRLFAYYRWIDMLDGYREDYRQGLVPLIVPLTLLQPHLRRHPVPDWVHQQVYLNPYLKELMLRNHV